MTTTGALMTRELQGNLLADDAEALVNTVNTVGVMGKGIALQFKRAYPEMFRDYAKAAKAGEVVPGRMHVWETGAMGGPKYVINFPTKRHWKASSRLEDIDAGLADLVRVVREMGIESIALPPLGCGNGGLEWGVVAPRIRSAFEVFGDGVDVRLYVPAGAPPASAMVTRTRAPKLTPVRAALLKLMSAYHSVTFEWPGLVDTQKLAYFLQEGGEPMRLNFTKGSYGPYADNLRQALRDMEGHFITGFGDGSARPFEAEPLEVTNEARAALTEKLDASPETADRLDRVLDLVAGFEGTYDLELLATVHWVANRDGASSPEEASRQIRSWTARKADLFGPDHVETAWRALDQRGWMRVAQPA